MKENIFLINKFYRFVNISILYVLMIRYYILVY